VDFRRVRNAALRLALKTGRRLARGALLRYVKAAPRAQDAADGEPRIYFLLYTAWGMGGTIRAVLNLADHLAERHPVTILSVRRTSDQPFFPFPPGVEVETLDDRGRPPKVPHALRRVLLNARSSVLADPADHVAAEFTVWGELRLARRLRRRTGFLIGTRPGLNILAAELAPPGMVLVGQDNMNLTAYSEALRERMLRFYPGLDAVVLLTERDRSSYRERFDGRARLEQIPNAARDMGPERADLDAKVVISAGRLTSQKGYDLLIGAFEQLATDHPDWRLRIFGAGHARVRLKRMIKQRGLAGAVTLAPPAADLAAEMERASVYALSSRFEGMPLVLLEAMSKGMAVVATDCPTGPAELIEDHRNGLLVPTEDVDALAGGLRELMEDAELRRRCAAAAVETARGYGIATVGERWQALLDELWATRAT
jgi:glycosyltransferase involved in cell wall biosynthesis